MFRRVWFASAFSSILLVVSSMHLCAQLRVGAAKESITPPANQLPPPFLSIHDPLSARAIYVDNGKSSALLMTADLGAIQQPLFERIADQIARNTGVPRDNILLSATHDHSAPEAGALPPFLTGGAPPSPNGKLYGDLVEQAIVKSASEAKASAQPAQIGFGEGKVYLNVNRDGIDTKTRQWAQEANPDYPSDKTLAVVEFRKPDGTPIAIYMNYAMHAVTMYLRQEVSGDFPEAAATYLEHTYGHGLVALWSSGAAGDQNPLYLRATLSIDNSRIYHEMEPSKLDNDPGQAEFGDAIMRLMFGGAKRSVLPMDPLAAEQAAQMVQSMGQIIAEETIRVVDGMEHFSLDGPIAGSSTVIDCAGRSRLDHSRQGSPGAYTDGPPVHITVGSLQIGDVVFGRVNGEVYNKIGQSVKAESPFRHTVFVTLTDGAANSGYIPSDDAFERETFQVLSSRLKKGCAERGIVTTITQQFYDFWNSVPTE